MLVAPCAKIHTIPTPGMPEIITILQSPSLVVNLKVHFRGWMFFANLGLMTTSQVD